MNWHLVRAIASHDVKLAARNKAVTLPMGFTAVIFLIVMPLGVVLTMGSVAHAPDDRALELLAHFPNRALDTLPAVNPAGQLVYLALAHLMTPLFITLPIMLAGVLAADSFAGERERKTLEYTLNSPVTDLELIVAKMFAAWIPALSFAFVGLIPYLVAANLVLYPIVGHVALPDTSWLILLFGVIPGASLFTLGISVLISSKVDSFQAAYQSGPLVTFPFLGLTVSQLTGGVFLDVDALALLCVGLWVAALAVVLISVRSFRRDQLFGKGSKAVLLDPAAP